MWLLGAGCGSGLSAASDQHLADEPQPEPAKCDKSPLAIGWDAPLGFLEPEEEKQIADEGYMAPFRDKAGFSYANLCDFSIGNEN